MELEPKYIDLRLPDHWVVRLRKYVDLAIHDHTVEGTPRDYAEIEVLTFVQRELLRATKAAE